MNIYPLHPAVQNYVWGGYEYIPELLGIKTDEKPYAEIWYGAHPLAPSMVTINDQPISLQDFIRSNPEAVLGKESVDQFGPDLPFLLKILDVRDMLSLQLHPSKGAARRGFEQENAAGIPLNAAHRNYKDANHKPELMLALSPFYLLQGFASFKEIKKRVETWMPQAQDLLVVQWPQALNNIWALPESRIKELLDHLWDHIHDSNFSDKSDIIYWVQKAIINSGLNKYDRGILILFLMHLQYLSPGQVAYQAPGVMHAYLEGQNLELMANSDNVLRGGLTPKHIDPIELMKYIRTDISGQNILEPFYFTDHEIIFRPPVNDFYLKSITMQIGISKEIQSNSASILLVLEGEIEAPGYRFKKGDSIFIPAFECLKLKSVSDEAKIFIASNQLS